MVSDAGPLADASYGTVDIDWHLVAESIPHIVWIAAADGRVEYINQQGNEYMGWQPGMAHARDWLEAVHPDDVAGAGASWEHASRPGLPFAAEYRLRRVDGEYRWHMSRGLPMRNAGGDIVRWIGTVTDIHDQRTAEAVLKESHRTTAEALTLLATLQDEAPVAFGLVDLDLRLVRLNRELASMARARVEDLQGRGVAAVVPELWEQLEPVYRHVLETGEAVRNLPISERSGASPQRDLVASHYPVHIGDEMIGIGMVVVDVTDRLALAGALHELTRAEEFRSAVMGEMAEGVYTLDCDGRLQYMNSAASKMLGWTEAELHGQILPDAVDLDDGGTAFTRKDGSTFPVAYSSVPLHDEFAGEGVAVIFRDVSAPGRSPNVIRVLIVDSDRTALVSFQALLDRHEGIVVVSTATTSATAREQAVRLVPDVVLIDVGLPDLGGVATAALIKATNPSSNVILMSEKYNDAVALAGIEAGCAGVLDKGRAWVELVSAVRAAYHGETTISQAELQRVVSKVRGGGHPGRATELTDREEEVLACMREGLSNAQVANRLGITPNTVRNHVQRILFKLNVHSKLEAVVITSREGLQQGRG